MLKAKRLRNKSPEQLRAMLEATDNQSDKDLLTAELASREPKPPASEDPDALDTPQKALAYALRLLNLSDMAEAAATETRPEWLNRYARIVATNAPKNIRAELKLRMKAQGLIA